MVAAGCEGMSFRGVEARMTLDDVGRLNRAWGRNGPPMYATLAAYAGWKPQKEQTDDERFDDLIRMFGDGGG